MKVYIYSLPLIVISFFFLIFQDEYNRLQRHLMVANYHAEEVAAAAAQYIDWTDYAEGRIVFNQFEGQRAAEYLLKKRMLLDDLLMPQTKSYWIDRIQYEIEFFDESNTVFPYLYQNPTTNYTRVLESPSVVVTIYLGRGRLSFYESPEYFRTAAHAWKGR